MVLLKIRKRGLRIKIPGPGQRLVGVGCKVMDVVSERMGIFGV